MQTIVRVKILLFFISVGFAFIAQAQVKKADKEYELHAYKLAIQSYLDHLEKTPDDLQAIANLASSYYHLNQMTEAIRWYQRAIELNGASPRLIFDYAQALKALEQYPEAKNWFLKYAETDPEAGNHFAETCDFANSRRDLPPLYEISTSKQSSAASDFGATFFKDKVVYASSRRDLLRANDKLNSSWTGQAFNQLLVVTDLDETPELLLNDLKNNYNMGPLAYSAAGNLVVYTQNNFVEGTRQIPSSGMRLSLYVAEVSPDGSWSNARAFPYNNSSYSNGYPSLSSDGNTLYFASDRPDGFGGFDIFVSHRQGATWSTPENLGGIVNTRGNEISPFFDGRSLFFSSDWHPGFGGLDIFRAEISNGAWNKVYHLGSQINSSRDDYGFVFNSLKNLGFLTSNRTGGQGHEDIYQISKMTDNVVIKVVEENSLNPVAEAIIDFSACGERTFKTGSDGSYSFQALPGLDCQAEVRKAGYLASSFNLSTKGSGAQLRTIEVRLSPQNPDFSPPVTTDSLAEPIISERTYFGRLVNIQSKQVLDNVLVRATSQSGGPSIETITDWEGAFSLQLRENQHYILHFSKAGFSDLNKSLHTQPNQDNNLGSLPMVPSITSLDDHREVSTDNAVVSTGNDLSTAEQAGGSGFEYAIQVAAVFNKPDLDLAEYRSKLRDIGNVYKRQFGQATRIRVGLFDDRDVADEILMRVKELGYPNAFVVEDQRDKISAPPKPQPVVNKETSPPTPEKVVDAVASTPDNVAKKEVEPPAQANPKKPANSSIYKVRIGSYKDSSNFDETKLEGVGFLERYEWNNFTIFVLGGFPSRTEAEQAVKTARAAGFSDAVLVTHQNGRLKSVRD